MRFIFGVGSRLFVWETSVERVAMRVTGGDSCEDEEDYKQPPPMDPHGTLSSHCELSPNAIYDGSAQARRFGFHGSEDTGS